MDSPAKKAEAFLFFKSSAQKMMLNTVELDNYLDVLVRPICNVSLLA